MESPVYRETTEQMAFCLDQSLHPNRIEQHSKLLIGINKMIVKNNPMQMNIITIKSHCKIIFSQMARKTKVKLELTLFCGDAEARLEKGM